MKVTVKIEFDVDGMTQDEVERLVGEIIYPEKLLDELYNVAISVK